MDELGCECVCEPAWGVSNGDGEIRPIQYYGQAIMFAATNTDDGKVWVRSKWDNSDVVGTYYGPWMEVTTP